MRLAQDGELMAFLRRPDDVNHLMMLLHEHVSTRSMWHRLTTSCRKWQLVLLCALHAGPHLDVPRVRAMLRVVLQQTDAESPTPIRALIVRNRPSPTEVSVVTGWDDLVWDETQHDARVACLCLYIRSYAEMRHADGCILHYFTLLRRPSGRIFLSSSYASDYVCMSQSTKAISRRTLSEFCAAIGEPGKSERVIRSFFETFFVPREMMWLRVEHEPERRCALTTDERVDAEIRVYTHNRHTIAVGQLTRYSEHIREIRRTL